MARRVRGLDLDYRHTQTSSMPVVLSLVALVIAVIAVAAAGGDGGWILVIVVLIVVGALTIFSRLTVTVAAGAVEAAFGFGWPRRSVDVRDITAIRQVRNSWWHGWGIRWIPGGSMYNVAGLDAVELELASGKVFRIGCDECSDLLAALSLHTSLRPSDEPR